MDAKKKYRLRVETCIRTIIDVHKSINSSHENEGFLSQFEKLKSAIKRFDMQEVSEGDVIMVEQATNALLSEFRPLPLSDIFSLHPSLLTLDLSCLSHRFHVDFIKFIMIRNGLLQHGGQFFHIFCIDYRICTHGKGQHIIH